MKDFAGLMKQAQQMQENLAKAQEELDALEVVGAAGAGLVQVTLNGKGEARRVAIDPSLIKEGEGDVLEDLLVAAFNDAKRKSEDASQEKIREAAGALGGMLPPGFLGPK